MPVAEARGAAELVLAVDVEVAGLRRIDWEFKLLYAYRDRGEVYKQKEHFIMNQKKFLGSMR